MDQETIKTKLKAWLKFSNKTYADVAEACYVTESTIRNWMAKKKIPIAKIRLIEQLMNSTEVSTDVFINKEEKTIAADITPAAAIDMLRQLKQSYPELDYTQSVLALIGELSLR